MNVISGLEILSTQRGTGGESIVEYGESKGTKVVRPKENRGTGLG